jgi:hypothetical protein
VERPWWKPYPATYVAGGVLMAICIALNVLPLDGGSTGFPLGRYNHWLLGGWFALLENVAACTVLVLIGCDLVERWVRRCKRTGRPCFQYHLTTALAAAALAAVLMWANTRTWEDTNELGRGWPFDYARSYRMVEWGTLLGNALLCSLVVLSFGILVEAGVRCWAKRRRRRRGSV